jgi:hypothetical protein
MRNVRFLLHVTRQALLNERLWKAAAMGQAEVCAELIELGADVNSQVIKALLRLS